MDGPKFGKIPVSAITLIFISIAGSPATCILEGSPKTTVRNFQAESGQNLLSRKFDSRNMSSIPDPLVGEPRVRKYTSVFRRVKGCCWNF
jgi:hypothetical protein